MDVCSKTKWKKTLLWPSLLLKVKPVRFWIRNTYGIFSTGNIWLKCCLSGCSSSTWEVSTTIFKLFTGFPITRWLLVHFLLSLVLLCPRMPKQRCREERPGRRKIKSKNTGAGVRRPSFLFSLHRKAEQTVLVPWTSHTLHIAKPLSMPGKPCFSLKSRLR